MAGRRRERDNAFAPTLNAPQSDDKSAPGAIGNERATIAAFRACEQPNTDAAGVTLRSAPDGVTPVEGPREDNGGALT